MKKSLLLFCCVTAFVMACKHEIINPGGSSGGDGSDTSGNGSGLVCFEGEILPIFQSSCAKGGCHDAATHEEGYVFDNYANITRKGIKPGKPNDSEVLEVIEEGEMPPEGNTPLTADQIALIRQWISEGAKNTTNCSDCDADVYTYSGAIQGIMQTNCVGCHSTILPNGSVDLSTYSGVEAVAIDGRLLGTVTHSIGYSAMPQGGKKLSDCNISQIERWVADGAPDN